MYKYFFIALTFLMTSYAQKPDKNFSNLNFSNSYPIAGSDLLRDKELEVSKFLKENPGYFNQLKLKKTTSWNFTVGDKKSWFAYSWPKGRDYSILSTCKAVGTHCYVFVADDVWGSNVDSSAVLAVMNDFDSQTPADPGKGIYQMDSDTFGDPPNVDNDDKIIILILDIQDGFDGSGGFVAGYFDARNEVRIAGEAAEIYFMDCNPTNLKTSSGINQALATAAHEFQHMINWNYHKSFPEATFINEGLSMVAEIVCGYGASMQSLYANEPNHYLFDWRKNDNTLVLNDYARAQRFFLYIMEQLGVSSLKEIVQDYANHQLAGLDGLNKILSNYSTSLGKFFLNWEIANGLNNVFVNPAYGYSYQPIPVTTGELFYNPNINLTSSTLDRLGAEYYTFSKSSDLNVTFSSDANNIVVKAIEIGDGGSRVVDVPLNANFNEPDYPFIYNTIRFAVIDTGGIVSEDYQYQSSGIALGGVTELKWDDGQATDSFSLTPGDSLCVIFDPFPGGKLDSIRVGLLQAGSIEGSIWDYNSNFNFENSPLGRKLSESFIASISTSVHKPFPVPWNNWSKIDLQSSNIFTDEAFIVAFAVPEANDPEVMVSETNGKDFANSLTYDNSSGWLYYISDHNTTYQYLIRAYVSIITGTGKQEIELTPAVYSLSQNYPNPFNPSTNIKFQIARDGFVSLKLYDILGHELQTLVNEYKTKGEYNIKFDASNLASGIYLYRIQAGNFTSVKKLMVLK